MDPIEIFPHTLGKNRFGVIFSKKLHSPPSIFLYWLEITIFIHTYTALNKYCKFQNITFVKTFFTYGDKEQSLLGEGGGGGGGGR
jgi:hypothetical protein